MAGVSAAAGADSVAGAAAGLAVLLAPLRHYVGPMKRVTEAKIEHDSFPLSTYPMFSIDRGAVSAVATVVGFVLVSLVLVGLLIWGIVSGIGAIVT